MNGANRILMNTIAQYAKTIINLFLALYSTRLILEALGNLDYGLYSVITGAVSMLSFVNNSLVISTQRHLSFLKGKNKIVEVRCFFANSLFIHIILGLLFFILLIACTDIIIEKVLSIPTYREQASAVVYISISAVISLTFITSPFRAIFIARENIVFISIIDIIDAVLKLLIALILLNTTIDKLILYGLLLVGISFFNLLAFSIYAYICYDEFCWPKIGIVKKQHIKKITSFAGWTLFSTGCVIGRTQGLAILFNVFYGVLINTAYGIAQQISGAVMNISQAIANAMSPQIIKAEGKGERTKMLYMSSIECLCSYTMLSIFAIPLIFKMSLILKLWLVDVPEYSVLFCRYLLIACLFDQITGGLSIANQASGNIRNYSIIFGVMKILTLPISYIIIQVEGDLNYVLLCFVSIELISSFSRVLFIHKSAGLIIKDFFRRIIVPIICSSIVASIVCYKLDSYLSHSLFSFLVLLISNMFLIIFITILLLKLDDKQRVMNIITGMIKKYIKYSKCIFFK